jgi:hypothetical protein
MGARRRTLVFVLKLVFGLGVVAFLVVRYRTSLPEIGPTLASASWSWLLLAFSLHVFGLLFSAYRWQILARAQGDRIPLLFLIKSYLVGTFFSLFLPTRFGGDVVRVWDGSKYSNSMVRSTAVIFVERLTGLMVLFFVAAGASLLRLEIAREIPVVWVALVIGLVGLAALGLFFLPATGRLLGRGPARGVLRKAFDKLAAFRAAIIQYRDCPAVFFWATLWAVLLQINVVAYYLFIGRALHLKIPVLDYFVFIPLVLIAQTIPISINGLGVRETAYIQIFAFYGLSAGTALSFDLIEIAFGLIVGLIGAAVYVARK